MEWDQSLRGNVWNILDCSVILRNRLRFRSHTAIALPCHCRTRILLHNSRHLRLLLTMSLPMIREAYPTLQVPTPMCRNTLATTPQSANNDSTQNRVILEEAVPLLRGPLMGTINMHQAVL